MRHGQRKACMTPDEVNKEMRTRRDEWQARLGRLRLGAEPIQEQVARQRRVTWALTLVMTMLGLLFFSLFTGFGRADIGAVLVGVLVGPILVIAWRDYHRMANRARTYLEESDAPRPDDGLPNKDLSTD
jgi:Flp pilus assembly protein TadB